MAFPTGWTISTQIKADNTKVSGASNLSNFPALIKDTNIPNNIYAGLDTFFNDANMQGYWRFDSSSADETANNNDGTDTAMTYAIWAGKFGNGAYFSNSSRIVYPTRIINSGAGSVGFWVSKSSPEVDAATIYSCGLGWDGDNAGIYAWLGSDGKIIFLHRNGIADAQNYCISTSAVTGGLWHHVVHTWTGDTSANGHKVYVDGTLQTQSTPTFSDVSPSGSNTVFGSARYNSNLYNFDDGIMDEAFLSNRVLTATEVSNLYNSGRELRYADGNGLRITTDSAGTTEIPFQIVSMDTVAKTAEVWVKIPSLLTASDTSIWLWAGNSTAAAYLPTDTYGSQAVWSGFGYVDHLEGQSLDSTSTGTNGTDTDVTYSTGNGKLGVGAGFNGSTSKVLLGDILDPTTNNYTIEAWVNFTSIGTGEPVVISKNSYDAAGVYFSGQSGTAKFSTGYQATNAVSTTSLSNGTWYHVVSTRFNNGGGEQVKVYINGVNETTQNNAGYTNLNIAQNLMIGARQITAGTYRDYFTGKVDEVRVLLSTLSADWIATEYANQNSPSTFWTTVTGISPLPTHFRV